MHLRAICHWWESFWGRGMIRKDELLSTFSGLGLHMGERELPGAHLVWKLDSRNFRGLERLMISFELDNSNKLGYPTYFWTAPHSISFCLVLMERCLSVKFCQTAKLLKPVELRCCEQLLGVLLLKAFIDARSSRCLAWKRWLSTPFDVGMMAHGSRQLPRFMSSLVLNSKLHWSPLGPVPLFRWYDWSSLETIAGMSCSIEDMSGDESVHCGKFLRWIFAPASSSESGHQTDV